MKTFLFDHYFVGCIILILISGCASVAKVEKPQINIESVIAKLKSTGTAKAFNQEEVMKSVGVVIELKEYVKLWRGVLGGGWRKEEDVFQMASAKVLSSLEKAGIGAALLYDENDPRLENIGIILYVKYSERKETERVWDPKAVYIALPLGGMYAGGYKEVPKIVESYDIDIYDIKTRKEVNYYNLEDAVNALK